jgi:biotin operon repressor
MQGHTGWVWSLQGIGYQVWSGSGDKTIRIWAAEVIFTIFLRVLIFQDVAQKSLSAVSPNISRNERSPARPTSPMPTVTFSSPPVSPIPGRSPGHSTVPTASTPAANNNNGTLSSIYRFSFSQETLDDALEISRQTIKHLEYWSKQAEAENQEMSKRVQIRETELDNLREQFKQDMDQMRDQLRRQADEKSQLEKSRVDLQSQLEELQDTKVAVEIQGKERNELKQAKWKLQKELEEARILLGNYFILKHRLIACADQERTQRESSDSSRVNLEKELRAAHRILEDDLIKSLLDTDNLNSSMSVIDLSTDTWTSPQESYQETKRLLEKHLENLNSQVKEEATRRTHQQTANLLVNSTYTSSIGNVSFLGTLPLIRIS